MLCCDSIELLSAAVACAEPGERLQPREAIEAAGPRRRATGRCVLGQAKVSTAILLCINVYQVEYFFLLFF